MFRPGLHINAKGSRMRWSIFFSAKVVLPDALQMRESWQRPCSCTECVGRSKHVKTWMNLRGNQSRSHSCCFRNIEDFWKFCEAVVDGQGYLVHCQCQTDNTEWLKITCALFAMIHGIKGKWKFKQFVFFFFFLSFLFFFYEALKNVLPPRANVGVPAAQEHR